jgi:hypothetical protein
MNVPPFGRRKWILAGGAAAAPQGGRAGERQGGVVIEVGWDEVPPRSFSTTDFAMEAIDVEPLGEAPGAIPFRGLQQGRTPDDMPHGRGHSRRRPMRPGPTPGPSQRRSREREITTAFVVYSSDSSVGSPSCSARVRPHVPLSRRPGGKPWSERSVAPVVADCVGPTAFRLAWVV